MRESARIKRKRSKEIEREREREGGGIVWYQTEIVMIKLGRKKGRVNAKPIKKKFCLENKNI